MTNNNFMVQERSSSRVVALATAALMAALLAVAAQITVPFGPIPFTMQTAVVLLIALIFSPKQAAASTGLYLLLGAIGLPVFSAGRSGLGTLFGPTGGFLFSYVVAVFVAAFVREVLENRGKNQFLADGIAIAIVLIIQYLMGTIQYVIVASVSVEVAFATAVLPFIFVDLVKAVLAFVVAQALRRAIPTLLER